MSKISGRNSNLCGGCVRGRVSACTPQFQLQSPPFCHRHLIIFPSHMRWLKTRLAKQTSSVAHNSPNIQNSAIQRNVRHFGTTWSLDSAMRRVALRDFNCHFEERKTDCTPCRVPHVRRKHQLSIRARCRTSSANQYHQPEIGRTCVFLKQKSLIHPTLVHCAFRRPGLYKEVGRWLWKERQSARTPERLIARAPKSWGAGTPVPQNAGPVNLRNEGSPHRHTTAHHLCCCCLCSFRCSAAAFASALLLLFLRLIVCFCLFAAVVGALLFCEKC